MNVSISVSGSESVSAAAERINAALPQALLAGAEAVAECARGMCPVDTGALRSSISVSADGAGAVVSAGEDYAVYVEFGTYKTPAQPFLAPALSAAAGEMTAAILGGLTS